MMKWLKKYWWIIVVILLPIGLNFILSCNTPWGYSVIGDSKDWLNFWGGYLGAVIMAGVTLYVLNKQLKQNHKENICNAILQIATLTNNEEKAHIDKLAEALVDFQSSFDYLTINQVVERMLKNQFLASDVDLLNNLVRDVDRKGFRVDILLKPIPKSKFINEYNAIYNRLYNGYGLLISDLIFFIDLMKDLPKDREKSKAFVLRKFKHVKIIDADTIPDALYINGFNPPKKHM